MASAMEKIIYKNEIEEYDVMHNNVLGAHSLWEFVRYYNKYHNTSENPDLILLMPILPIIFNGKSCNLICRRNFREGSLIKVLIEDKTIFIGLQKRMEEMSFNTFNSLRIAFSMNLLTIDKSNSKIISTCSINPNLELSSDYSDIIAGSRRLGAWFAKYDFAQLINYLNITF